MSAAGPAGGGSERAAWRGAEFARRFPGPPETAGEAAAGGASGEAAGRTGAAAGQDGAGAGLGPGGAAGLTGAGPETATSRRLRACARRRGRPRGGGGRRLCLAAPAASSARRAAAGASPAGGLPAAVVAGAARLGLGQRGEPGCGGGGLARGAPGRVPGTHSLRCPRCRTTAGVGLSGAGGGTAAAVTPLSLVAGVAVCQHIGLQKAAVS